MLGREWTGGWKVLGNLGLTLGEMSPLSPHRACWESLDLEESGAPR